MAFMTKQQKKFVKALGSLIHEAAHIYVHGNSEGILYSWTSSSISMELSLFLLATPLAMQVIGLEGSQSLIYFPYMLTSLNLQITSCILVDYNVFKVSFERSWSTLFGS